MATQLMKSVYEVGERPPLGFVPQQMHASVIRPQRYGEPSKAFALETVNVPAIGDTQVLVYVMAAGVNYNNVWAALGQPVDVVQRRQRAGAKEDFHIGGSDASGIVWATGKDVHGLKVGDHVVLSCCMWDPNAADIRSGVDPTASTSTRIWGYEENYGSFAQFTRVDEYQCYPKPSHLTWEAAAAYMLVGATAYRQLLSWTPHHVQPNDIVLIWGGAGGLGSLAIQLVREFGGIPVAVVSDSSRAEYCLKLGAKGVINRNDFSHWGRLPAMDDTVAFRKWIDGARAFGERIWEIVGERRNPRIVFEHPGEATIPTSMYVCDNAGMVVICAGTSGYAADVDLRYLWMRQKRLQGSHFANPSECSALNRLVAQGRIDPCLSRVFTLDDVGAAHQLMFENHHPPGNMSILVGAAREGLVE